ncbi:MAG: formimidoylglutamate deiminase [Steroidobacteraceae bacterium]
MIWCPAMIGSLFCATALLPAGWRRNVRIGVRGGLIDTVTPDAAPEPGDERAAIVVPGMPNVHSHAFQRAMAGLAERAGPQGADDFWSWRELMYRFLARLGPDDVESIAAYAYADMLEAGFTSVGEFHYLHRTPEGRLYADPAELALRHLAAAESTGIGLALLPVFYEASGFGGAPPTEGQKRFVTSLDEFSEIVARVRTAMRAAGPGAEPPRERGAGRRIGIAPHSLRAVTPEGLASLTRLYPRERFHIHAAEQLQEVTECIAWSGRRPVEWLLDHAGIDERWCLVHATHLAPSEIAALAESGAIAGLCPLTEANLGDGTFPAVQYTAASGRWAIGSDANIHLDAAGELRQLEFSQRLLHRVRNALAAPERSSTGRCLFEAAAAGGARALGDSIGAIAPNHRADFVILDESHPDLEGRSDDALLDTWIFAGGRTMIRAVLAGGERVVERRRHRDRERLDAAYRRVVSRLIV